MGAGGTHTYTHSNAVGLVWPLHAAVLPQLELNGVDVFCCIVFAIRVSCNSLHGSSFTWLQAKRTAYGTDAANTPVSSVCSTCESHLGTGFVTNLA
jgi:hypothetical protein